MTPEENAQRFVEEFNDTLRKLNRAAEIIESPYRFVLVPRLENTRQIEPLAVDSEPTSTSK